MGVPPGDARRPGGEAEEDEDFPVMASSSHARHELGALGARPRVSRQMARQRLGAMSRLRLTRGTLLAALVTLVLGLAVVAQVRSTQEGDLESLRESDLVALLDDVTNRADGLEAEVRALERDRDALADDRGDAAAQEAAQSRLETYQVLAGTVPVAGEGVALTVTDPDGALTTTTLIDLIQELRDAGAEAIQIGGVRVVADTWIGTAEGGMSISGDLVVPPYRIVALGDGHTLAAALAIPGGFNDSVRRDGGTVEVTEGEELVVDAVHTPRDPQYSRPVPADEGR